MYQIARTWTYATGRGVGGTASVNSMIYTWPAQRDCKLFHDARYWPTVKELELHYHIKGTRVFTRRVTVRVHFLFTIYPDSGNLV